MVARQNSDGSWSLIQSTISNGILEFSVEHFCKFAIIQNDNEVSLQIQSVSISDISLTYKKGTTLKPEIVADSGVNYTVEYKSSNPKVATVDEKGNVVAIVLQLTN